MAALPTPAVLSVPALNKKRRAADEESELSDDEDEVHSRPKFKALNRSKTLCRFVHEQSAFLSIFRTALETSHLSRPHSSEAPLHITYLAPYFFGCLFC